MNVTSGVKKFGGMSHACVAAEQHDQACCTYCVRWRPKRRLRRFQHHLWICTCGQAWHTERGPYEKTTWLWRKWCATTTVATPYTEQETTK